MKEAIVDKIVSVIIRDVDIPTPEPGQVLIRVVVSGTNPKEGLEMPQNGDRTLSLTKEMISQGMLR